MRAAGGAIALGVAAVAVGKVIGDAIDRNRPEVHHIATNKNSISESSGGPWTPRFEPLFEKAGVSMDSWANKTVVFGHRGPHGEDYHRAVYDRLVNATRGLTGQAYTDALLRQLHILQVEVAAPGTDLNRMVTR
jgi:hypothetical protein